ncbi:tRNA (adenine(58)-N(1))-methyltransferase non-catalytic subunit trm6 [Pichia californica]|uniref:tRNA (adenine(58)-N(1))-methyltransferase non-catalytic subunit TRM6 n=1 Tax=Pichia californica TaxID=460514 RepID=A0A9P7BF09_9ASCO|nr:tRNA (adenine(58)-N(1))-methyltransferase non-catalytic subunit trm6 [[Candida] californica]KAG0689987.1 tRNA (adenine(58)-N(1))-methyltransferase non-catalytic subunit trm6 [[Candida] californica]
MEPHHNITVDDFAILRLPSGARKMIQLRFDGIINMGKFGTFTVEDVLGYPYGQAFEIGNENKLNPIESLEFGITDLAELDTEDLINGSSKDNRLLIDQGNVQKVTVEEVEEMKNKIGGNEVAREIIQTMIKNHGSFDKKTAFSQEKYLDRKHKKFLRRFQINYLTSNEMLDYLYYEKEPFRIMNLSIEMLGSIMSQGNVMPGGNYLVVDETGGLIVYAMLERMGNKGSITLLHENDQPSIHLLNKTRFSKEIGTSINSMVQCINVLQFLEPENEKPDFKPLTNEEYLKLPEPMKTQYDRKIKRFEITNNVIDRVLKNDFESLIYVSTLNPTTFIPRIIPRLRGSSPLVIYNQFKEVLVELNHIFLREKGILLPNIHHSVVRRYQTIPGRIHPLMTSRSDGGYILTGIKVFPIENVVAVGRGSKKRKTNSKNVEENESVIESTPEVV